MKHTLAMVIIIVFALASLFAASCDDDESPLPGSGVSSDDDDFSDDDDDDVMDDDDDDYTDDDDDDLADDDDDDDMADDDDDDDVWPPSPECDDYGAPAQTGIVQNPNVSELSGLAVSRRNPGVIWGLNDSGGGSYLYAFTFDGADLGSLYVTGAVNLDWEDLAIGPCGKGDCLYVADIGDNLNLRPTKSIYIVPEPEVDPAIPFGDITVSSAERITWRYPDGLWDAESMAVTQDGRIFVVSKVYGGDAVLYAYPENPTGEFPPLVYLGALDLSNAYVTGVATAADIHPNGNRLLVRTYQTAFEWRLAQGAPFEDIVTSPRFEVPAQPEPQSESIAYDPDSGGYIHASEMEGGAHMPIFHIECAD